MHNKFRAWAVRDGWYRKVAGLNINPSEWVKADNTRFEIFEPAGFPSLKVGSLQAKFGDRANLVSFTLTEREALKIYEKIFEANHGRKPYSSEPWEEDWPF